MERIRNDACANEMQVGIGILPFSVIRGTFPRNFSPTRAACRVPCRGAKERDGNRNGHTCGVPKVHKKRLEARSRGCSFRDPSFVPRAIYITKSGASERPRSIENRGIRRAGKEEMGEETAEEKKARGCDERNAKRRSAGAGWGEGSAGKNGREPRGKSQGMVRKLIHSDQFSRLCLVSNAAVRWEQALTGSLRKLCRGVGLGRARSGGWSR